MNAQDAGLLLQEHSVLDNFFPKQIAYCVTRASGSLSWLTDDERSAVEGASPSRRQEFAAGRACARVCMDRLSVPRASVLMAPDRSPIWPRGVVGSISHCRDLVIATLALSKGMGPIGVDVECLMDVGEELTDIICGPSELISLNRARAEIGEKALTLWFSAKEAVYKSFYPRFAKILEFRDVTLEIDLAGARFLARVQGVQFAHVYRGRFAFHLDKVFCFATAD